MKKFVALFCLMAMVVLTVVGCGASQDASSGESEGEVSLGIIQIVEHPALDAARQGFLDTLKENGLEEGKKLKVDYQNAQGDQSNLKTISQKFVNNKVDLVLAIATPSAISIASETEEIPILVTAVTDPAAAKLVESNEKPGTNVTGTTDMTPVKKQLELLKKIKPDVKTVGVIYNSSEINSEVQVNVAKEAAPELDLEIKEATVTNSSEVMQIAQLLGGKVDALYVPTDNVVASSIASVIAVAEENKIPLIVGESQLVENGALATIGIDYYELGRQTGDMALRVLNGSDPSEMAIESLENIDIVINKDAATRMGVEIPEEVISQAKKIIE